MLEVGKKYKFIGYSKDVPMFESDTGETDVIKNYKHIMLEIRDGEHVQREPYVHGISEFVQDAIVTYISNKPPTFSVDTIAHPFVNNDVVKQQNGVIDRVISRQVGDLCELEILTLCNALLNYEDFEVELTENDVLVRLRDYLRGSIGATVRTALLEDKLTNVLTILYNDEVARYVVAVSRVNSNCFNVEIVDNKVQVKYNNKPIENWVAEILGRTVMSDTKSAGIWDEYCNRYNINNRTEALIRLQGIYGTTDFNTMMQYLKQDFL